jgi:hypothetical protein
MILSIIIKEKYKLLLHFLTCRFNSTSAYYKARANTTQNNTNTEKGNSKQTTQQKLPTTEK